MAWKFRYDPVELEIPLYFFKLYFPDGLFDTMAECTNLYSTQKGTRFAFNSNEELKKFVGIHIIMGNLHYPRVRCYWHTKHSIRIPIIAENMAVNWFFSLRNHLHFVNIGSKDPNSSDRFWKVRTLFNIIRTRCWMLPLESELSVDEQIVLEAKCKTLHKK